MNILATIIIASVSLLFVSMALVPLFLADEMPKPQATLRSQLHVIEGGKGNDHLEAA